ncbi:TetR/AcrR family transcriptional regulator [Amycolatopsis nigrescens]|uniref:TetR/AcrR family transcriptional regulator n=1 Tax=Amycolatopsis nigrescens TaxID=381445 RepID=UPI00035CFDE0|nr:TetR/AcrR family transcriptional regulator [Amycolatopsis nigrescens]
MTEYSGSGDPKRTLELLWGLQERPSRGPKARLTVPEITATAVKLADADGFAALSMRRMAEQLGVSTMSLYTYVPSKAELLDLMVDAVYGETARPEPEEVPGGWRGRLEQIARENATLYHRHPWLLQVAISRPNLGPNQVKKYEYELGAVDGIGLTDLEMDAVLTLITGYVNGAVRGAIEAAQAEQRTGMTDLQWWEAHLPILEQVIDEAAYPLSTRVGNAAGEAYNAAYAPDQAFEFGLARVLDGIETLVRSRA